MLQYHEVQYGGYKGAISRSLMLTFCFLCLINLLIVSNCLFIQLCVHVAAAKYTYIFTQFSQ